MATPADMPFYVPLTAQEWRLVASLREIPTSPLRDLLTDLVQREVELVRDPSCAEAQADGVPCASVEVECADCRRVAEVLEGLRKRLRAA
jgi:hypothetical protein